MKNIFLFNQIKKSVVPRMLLTALLLIAMLNIPISGADKEEPQLDSNNSQELALVLHQAGLYCNKLKKAVFHFFCREKLQETVENQLKIAAGTSNSRLRQFFKGSPVQQNMERWNQRDVHSDEYAARQIRSNTKKWKKANYYVNDYQIIKQDNQIREQRMAVEVNGETVKQKKKSATSLLYSYKNALTPIYLFSPENQKKYKYALLGKEKSMGRDAYIVELSVNDKDALPVTKDNEDINQLALAWIDTEDFSIIKIKVMPGAIKGYRDMLNAEKKNLYNLKFSDIHTFGFLRKGIRYPTKTKILLSYYRTPKTIAKNSKGKAKKVEGSKLYTRVNTTITYDKYLFFDVAVSDPDFKDMEQNI